MTGTWIRTRNGDAVGLPSNLGAHELHHLRKPAGKNGSVRDSLSACSAHVGAEDAAALLDQASQGLMDGDSVILLALDSKDVRHCTCSTASESGHT